MEVLLAIGTIAVLFAVLLGVKSVGNFEFCVICAAVSGTWIPLLVLYHTGYYHDETVIALLIGQSIVGVFYYLKSTVPDDFTVFSLPGLLTATVIGYMALRPEALLPSVMILAILWTFGAVAFAFRNDDRFRTVFDQVIACCRDW